MPKAALIRRAAAADVAGLTSLSRRAYAVNVPRISRERLPMNAAILAADQVWMVDE